MSGGHFDYKCFIISQFAEELQHEIDINNDKTKNEFGDAIGYEFKPETISRLKIAHGIIKQAGELAREIEWLYSSDHGEDTFNCIIDKIIENNFN